MPRQASALADYARATEQIAALEDQLGQLAEMPPNVATCWRLLAKEDRAYAAEVRELGKIPEPADASPELAAARETIERRTLSWDHPTARPLYDRLDLAEARQSRAFNRYHRADDEDRDEDEGEE